MINNSKFTATTMSLPSKYVNGMMEIDEEKASLILKEAYQKGIRSFATAPQYLMGKCESFVGKVLKDVRKDVKLSTAFPFFDPTLCQENPVMNFLERTFETFQTDYIDCLNFYGEFLDQKHLQEAQKAKEKGLINHIGIVIEPHLIPKVKSIFDETLHMVDTVTAYFIPTIPDQLEIFAELKKKGIRLIAGGLVDVGLDSLSNCLLKSVEGFDDISATEIATRYFLKQEIFDEIVFLLKDKEYLDLVMESEKTIDKYSLAQLEPFFQNPVVEMNKPNFICSGCGYCMPCPKGIEITKLFNIYAYYDQFGMRDCATDVYLNYQEKLGTSIDKICNSCKLCEKRCFHRNSISSNLRILEKFMNGLSLDELVS